jgi:preprotein translocase subunit YajC
LTVPSIVSQFIAQATQTVTAATSAATSQGTQGTQPPGFAALLTNPIVPVVLGMIVLMYVMNRSKRNQDKQLKDQLSQMKRGDKVMTIGGVLGNVVQVEDSRVLLKVDENSNTKIWFTREAIRRVVNEEKAEAAK